VLQFVCPSARLSVPYALLTQERQDRTKFKLDENVVHGMCKSITVKRSSKRILLSSKRLVAETTGARLNDIRQNALTLIIVPHRTI